MTRILQIVIICYSCLILIILFDFGKANEPSRIQHRHRRYLSFGNFSHFFLRLNFKANMVPWNQIFAQALGFRMNWNDPPDSFHPYHRLYRRTVYSHLETLLDRNGLEGFHCVRRAICEMDKISQPRGIYYKILKMVFRRISAATDKWHNATEEDCRLSITTCPFSMLEVSTYTDF
ncbi:unnamed protein product [Parnassius mnemosyne]|uniref:Uncharacterized protein n=1 Tax=Parnassius mnemosyne TaxID=213953 RepID=A0AAV1KFF2_9NEOP